MLPSGARACGRLSHSISMLGCLAEMTDPDVVLEAEKEAGTLLDALVEKNGLELVVQNLKRLDESREEDVRGVNYTLQVGTGVRGGGRRDSGSHPPRSSCSQSTLSLLPPTSSSSRTWLLSAPPLPL